MGTLRNDFYALFLCFWKHSEHSRMSNLISQFQSVNDIVKKYGATLIAVSKYKPSEDIRTIYEGAGHLHYGENYIQEMEEKIKVLWCRFMKISRHLI
jgi:uncharacterized pyridoxal phosphate-containing UPF0001 family protein